MARYGQAFKDRAVARLLPPESAAVEVVAREVGVGAETLERWREDARRPRRRLATRPRAPVVYACDDCRTLRVRFAREGAQVTLPDEEKLLLQQPFAGEWYGTAQHELRGKADEATWTVEKRRPSKATQFRSHKPAGLGTSVKK